LGQNHAAGVVRVLLGEPAFFKAGLMPGLFFTHGIYILQSEDTGGYYYDHRKSLSLRISNPGWCRKPSSFLYWIGL